MIAHEALGYVASSLIIISLLMKSMVLLRIINMIGAIVFVVYGILIHAYPVTAMNSLIIIINGYHLYLHKKIVLPRNKL